MTSVRTAGRPRDTAIDEAILSATWEGLGAVGYSALTMTAVAEAAGVQKPALYRRWPSKPLLVVDALAAHLPALEDVDHGSLEEDLRYAIRQTARTWSTTAVRRSFGALSADLDTDPVALEAFGERVLAPRGAALHAALERAAARGDLRPGAPLDVVGDLLEGPVMHRATVRRGEMDERLVESILTTCLELVRRVT